MKKIIIVFLLLFSRNLLAITDMEFEMSNIAPESNSSSLRAEYVIENQKSADEIFSENKEKEVKKILSANDLKQSLLSNLHYFNKDVQRKEFFLGYMQLGGVDFDLMYRIFMQRQKDMNYAFEQLLLKENDVACQNVNCTMNFFYKAGVDWGKYSMIDFWLKSSDMKEKRKEFIMKDSSKIPLDYLNTKNSPNFIKRLNSKIAYKAYRCNDKTECLNHIGDIDIYSKIVLLCNNDLMNQKKMKLFKLENLLIQQCLFSYIIKDPIIKRQFFYEGFFEGYTKYLRFYPERRF